TYNAYPDAIQMDLNGAHPIDRVVLYTLQDNFTHPVEPTDTMTFSLFGVTDFYVQGWTGSSWVTLATVNGNNLVKRTVTFPAFTTTNVRVYLTGALNGLSRL